MKHDHEATIRLISRLLREVVNRNGGPFESYGDLDAALHHRLHQLGIVSRQCDFDGAIALVGSNRTLVVERQLERKRTGREQLDLSERISRDDATVLLERIYQECRPANSPLKAMPQKHSAEQIAHEQRLREQIQAVHSAPRKRQSLTERLEEIFAKPEPEFDDD